MNEDSLLPVIESTIVAVMGGLRPVALQCATPSASRQAAADTREIVAFIAMAAVDCHVAMTPPELADAIRNTRSSGLAHVASFLTGNGVQQPREQVRAMLDMQIGGADIVGWGRDPTRLFAPVGDIERVLSSRSSSTVRQERGSEPCRFMPGSSQTLAQLGWMKRLGWWTAADAGGRGWKQAANETRSARVHRPADGGDPGSSLPRPRWREQADGSERCHGH